MFGTLVIPMGTSIFCISSTLQTYSMTANSVTTDIASMTAFMDIFLIDITQSFHPGSPVNLFTTCIPTQ